MSSILFALTIVVLFLVLFACVNFAIEESPLKRANPVLASAASALCILAMFGGFKSAQQPSVIEIILIPWAALGISLLFVVIVCLVRKFYRGNVERMGDYEDDRSDRRDDPCSSDRCHDASEKIVSPNKGALTRNRERY